MKKILVLAMGLLLCMAYVEAGNIAYFGTGSAGDSAVIAHLQAAGHTVTSHSPSSGDETTQVDLANASDLVIISESIGSGNVSTGANGRFYHLDTETPVMSYEPYMFDEAKWATTFGNSGAQTELYITAAGASHPIAVAAGLSEGRVDVWNAARGLCFGQVGPGATVIATTTDGGGDATLFVYEAGSTLQDGTTVTPGIRIGLFLEGGGGPTPAAMTADGVALFDAAVDYALGGLEIEEFAASDPETGSTFLTDGAVVDVALTISVPDGATVTGYMISQTAGEPGLGDGGWAVPPAPIAYTITGGEGNTTLYALSFPTSFLLSGNGESFEQEHQLFEPSPQCYPAGQAVSSAARKAAQLGDADQYSTIVPALLWSGGLLLQDRDDDLGGLVGLNRFLRTGLDKQLQAQQAYCND